MNPDKTFCETDHFFKENNNKTVIIYGSDRKRVPYCQVVLILTFPACTYTRGALSQNIDPTTAAKTIRKKDLIWQTLVLFRYNHHHHHRHHHHHHHHHHQQQQE